MTLQEAKDHLDQSCFMLLRWNVAGSGYEIEATRDMIAAETRFLQEVFEERPEVRGAAIKLIQDWLLYRDDITRRGH